MTPQTPPLDIVTVAIAVASWMLGAEIAAIVGPYAVILLSALGGAAWSASRTPGRTRGGTVLHMVLGIGLALIATVPLSELLAHWADMQPRWVLAPAAALIAARPDWLWAQVRRRIDREDRS